jgi:14-3-3 protein epsilon
MVDFEKLLYQAKLSEAANRPEKTFSLIEQIIKSKKEDLNAEERQLFHSSYKHIITSIRASCNKINEIYENEKKKDSKSLKLIQKLKESLEQELKETCVRMLELIDKYLINKASSPDSRVLYFKLKGDYNRYLAMFFSDNNNYSSTALVAYTKATEEAESLSCINPIKIDLALSFSVFYYDVLKNAEEAINVATEALNEGIDKLEKIDDQDMKDATASLQMLKDNIDNWTKGKVDDI